MSTVSQHLQQIEASGLIRLAAIEPDLEYLFRHALVQDAAYESLLRQDRKRLHLLVAESLETLYPEHPDDLAPMLASHFFLAGDNRALQYYLQAGDVAYGMYANREAVMHYTRALEVAGWPISAVTSEQLIHLCLRCGRAYQFASQLGEAIAFYQQITDLAHTRADQPLELTAQIEYAIILSTLSGQSDFPKGKALAHKMLALARELGDRKSEARLLWTLLLPARFEGQAKEALAYGEQALAIASELGLREQRAYILNDLSLTYTVVGNIEKSIAANVEARKLWRELGNLPMLADSLSGSIPMTQVAGKYDQALEAANEAFQICRSIDNLWGQAYSGLFIPQVHLDRGEYDTAVEIIDRTLTLGARASFLAPEIYSRIILGHIYLCLGAFQEGHHQLQQSAEHIKSLKLPWASTGAAVTAQLHMAVGDLARAQACLDEGYRILAESNPDEFSPAKCWLPFVGADIRIAHGDYAGALEILAGYEQSVNLEPRFPNSPFIPEGLRIKARALIGLGQIETARDILHDAEQRAAKITARRLLWPILFTLSQVEAQLGNPAEAERCRRQAREIVAFIIGHIERADLCETFKALPDVKAILAS